MKNSSYVLKVLDNDDYFIVSNSKIFCMNKIGYYDFAERYIDVTGEFYVDNYLIGYYHTMLYVFRLLIPDDENFKLAKNIGLIESEKIDWEYWKDNVLRNKLSSNKLLVKKHALMLLKIKNDYYNFTKNLLIDYRRKRVNDPVGLVFNIAAIIFAVAGVIQVLQAANIIPPKK